MGNNTGLCFGNRNEEDLQKRSKQRKSSNTFSEDEKEDNTEEYRKTIQSVIITKPQLTFGEQMIEDVLNLIDENKTPYEQWQCLIDTESLKIYGFEWRKGDKSIVNVIRTQYILNCNLQTFQSLQLDDMKKINQKIEDFQVIEDNIEYKESIRYIAYKGIFMQSSRDFVYLKTSKQLNQHEYIEAAKSIEDNRKDIEKKRTRGSINLTGQLIQQIGLNKILIKQFIDVDFKMNVQLNKLQNIIVKEYSKYYQALKAYVEKQ